MANQKKLVEKEYRFSTTLAVGTTSRMTVESEVTGKIRQVTRHWPEGCNALVDIAFGVEDRPILPTTRDTYVALNDATPTVPVDIEVQRDDTLWVEFRNRDSVNSHTPAVIVNLYGFEGPE